MGPEISWTAWNSSPEKKRVKASLQISVEALGAPYTKDFPGGSGSKASAYNAGDSGSIPGLGRSPGEGNSNPLQYSCLENPIDGGAW